MTISGLAKDSFLGYNATGHSGPGTVKFRIKAAAGDSRLDWLPGGVQDKAQSVPFALVGGDWEEITINVPATGPLGIIRLRLPEQELPIEIDWIEIRSRNIEKPTLTEF